MRDSDNVPALSVVVVSFNDVTMLEACITSLAQQAADAGAEILVARAGGDGDQRLQELRGRYPAIAWVDAPAGDTIPRLRRRGLLAARGEIVGLLEDDCHIDPGWCAAALAAHGGTCIAAGGAVEPGPYRHGRDWAVYFYEYGRFMLPFAPHRASDLPGNNVTYRRRHALAALGPGDEGFYDVTVHEAWRRAGLELQITPSLIVTNCNSWPMSYLTTTPFHHGRGYAAQRVAGRPAAERLLRAAATPLLPAVQIFRLSRLTSQRGRLGGRLLASLPWLCIFAISWAAGECAGYVAGPGCSLERWR